MSKTVVQLAIKIERIQAGGVLALAHVEISIAGNAPYSARAEAAARARRRYER